MEPKLPTTNRGLEHGHAAATQGIERRLPTFSPEKMPENRPELERNVGEINPAELATPSLPQVVIPQTPLQSADPLQSDAPVAAPLAAADDDLIEKEWVDKAKQIVVTTKDDPYRREAEVSKLQVEYLQKRYGKELGASE